MPSIPSLTIGGVPLPLELLTGAASPATATTRASSTARAAAAKPAATARASGAKTPGTAKPTTAKATSKSTAKKSTTAKTTGYATKLPADFAFLRDPKLSIEEKLSRFIGMLMTRSEQDLQAQLEKMAPGSTAAGSAGTTSASGTSKPKSTKVSLWGLAKTLLPPLNLASQLVGDAKLRSLATQVSGPVLAAAATAVGLPMLAPLAQKYGPTLVGALTKDISLDLDALAGGKATSTASGSTSSTGSGSNTAKAAADATSEKAQLMELQRLQDRDKELFSLFSNMLKAIHDSRMTCIQNLR